MRRAVHGFATSGTWLNIARRCGMIVHEVAAALPLDLARRLRTPRGAGMQIDTGDCCDPAARSVALYVHYAASGQISAMVLRQLRIIAGAGFAIVFISNAGDIPEEQWQGVRAEVALAIRRPNFGLDFGAWRDAMPEVQRRWPAIDELMLANDSVLGPIHALEPVLETMRTGGTGLFGLTESVQGGPHLQSYMLLARGPDAVADVMRFLRRLYVSHSKWLLIQFSELRLARWMRRRRHRVAAVFGYNRVVRAAVADPLQQQRLMATQPALKSLDQLAEDSKVAMLYQWPVNPTRHLWHILATRFAYPFVKTDLVLRGLSGHPDLDRWEEVVPPDAPCPLPLLRAHLDLLAGN
ncbi:MAG TPA: rhamnan synthesis F family protein, partial [Acetobacteraceae bacterium]